MAAFRPSSSILEVSVGQPNPSPSPLLGPAPSTSPVRESSPGLSLYPPLPKPTSQGLGIQGGQSSLDLSLEIICKRAVEINSLKTVLARECMNRRLTRGSQLRTSRDDVTQEPSERP